MIVGRVKRYESDDELCISKLLLIIENDPNSLISFVAVMDSDNSYKGSLNGFDIVVNIVSTCRVSFDLILNFLEHYDVTH